MATNWATNCTPTAAGVAQAALLDGSQSSGGGVSSVRGTSPPDDRAADGIPTSVGMPSPAGLAGILAQ
ncbi:hypothetical protein G7Z17_g12758 [Cylindrodendrum hubeiense]|uniref:Uncharacterized protein n=1 Tax=Cylindrodendrum hubeiense TaxID=595255 RepID=A0A9P5GUW9_9HYPO|nr:hypothetical protein G7Z17_g12758 [Cylindrodendrum hubeiense]